MQQETKSTIKFSKSDYNLDSQNCAVDRRGVSYLNLGNWNEICIGK